AELGLRHWLGAIVEQISAGLDPRHVLVPSLRVHGHHEIGAAAGAEVPGVGFAPLVPGRKALDVWRASDGWCDVLCHEQDGGGDQLVGAGGAGAVDVGHPDDEVVHAADWAATRHWSFA